ncbi:SMI1/KNR4 family protein [Enterobacter hormaechei]|nr:MULTISPECIES: SMI1/KNR4 family protein [Enterobacter cloacae complex]ELX8428762.1 SMI1/KNR4 family protein [Enterobacter hormaechei subsp. hoffmannii]HCJ7631875.1 SMI1/KNR4 family protein [Enterobacter hormaechei subsp. xiangfangensis]EKP1098223.1 SMI1/KNR4 family protein [Enterobacter hormaechei]EKS6522814.1 SMI1/KNR4 family protein [Enterobacter hormaechei]EKU5016084.1 SMI1/KNR4 family protein [Enterobacter hormaechei]
MCLTGSENKLTVYEINAFNTSFDNHLPASFLDFYLKNNGGYPHKNEDGNPFMLGGFNPIKYGDLPIEQLYRDLVESFGKLRNMVSFAYDDGGNSFLLSLKSDDSLEKVFIFLMDDKEVELVSGSFSEFLEELFL